MRRLITIWVTLLLTLALPSWAQPWTMTVTTNADEQDNPWTDCPPPGSTDCSLREAILVANSNGTPADIILFDPSLNGATITLDPTLGGLWIGNDPDTTIDLYSSFGFGGGPLTIDASGLPYALSINSSDIAIWGPNGSPLIIQNAGTAVTVNPGADNFFAYNLLVRANTGNGINIDAVSNCQLEAPTVDGNGGNGIRIENVNNCTIIGAIVANNTQDGIAVIDSSLITIDNSTVADNGQDGFSSGIRILGNSQSITINFLVISGNGGNGITVEPSCLIGGACSAPADVTILYSEIFSNGFRATDGVGIQVVGPVRGTGFPFSVAISGNRIYQNAAQGILIEQAGYPNGPSNVFIEPAGGNGFVPNYIYDNNQEGIVIKDPGTDTITVLNNVIGVDDIGNPSPNDNSGIALVNGTRNNTIQGNEIAYNQYQNVLISDPGTNNNTIDGNTIWGGADIIPPQPYNNAGVVISDGASDNSITNNTIQYHFFDGIQIIGQGTNRNRIASNEIRFNGRGIAVINEFASDLQIGTNTPGPADTRIEANTISDNNGDGILLRRDGGGTVIRNNHPTAKGEINRNQGNGILIIGSSPIVDSNEFRNNNYGIHVLVYFGSDDSPATANDDVLSLPTIENNVLATNVLIGIYALDTPLGDLLSLYARNRFDQGNLKSIQQDWYGYVRVVNTAGNPVPGLTVQIQDALNQWTLTSAVSDPNGNYGPAGFDITSARSYFVIPQALITNFGNLVDYTPHWVYATDDPGNINQYFYDGDFPTPPGESGGAIESPAGSKVERYQFAQLVRPLQLQADLSVTKTDAPDPVLVGTNLTYTIVVTNNGPDPATNVTLTDTLPPGATFVSATPSQGSCIQAGGVVTCSLGTINPNTSVTATIVIVVNDPGSVMNTVSVTATETDPVPNNNSDSEPTQVEQPTGGDPPIWGSVVVFPTPEMHWGRGPNRDATGDGDLDDCLLRSQDLRTGRIVNTKIAVSCAPGDLDLYENTVVFIDTKGYVGLYDLSTGRVQLTPWQGTQPAIFTGRVTFATPDGQIALWELEKDQLQIIGFGSEPAIWESIIAFRGESGTIQYYDLNTATLSDTAQPGRAPALFEKLIAFVATDTTPELIRYYDIESGTVHDTGAVGTHPALWGRFIVFETEERLARADLNGDGDRQDRVIRYFDMETGQLFSTGIVGYEPDIYQETVAFWSYEPALHRDLNNDGDLHDPVVMTYRLGQELERKSGVAVTVLQRPNGIEFVPQRADQIIRVRVYDLMGRELFDSGFRARVLWTLQFASGRPVANGVYLYVVTATELQHPARGKVVVLR